MHRRDPNSAGSLPAISEDGTSFLEPRLPPPIPARSSGRPSTRIWASGAPPKHSFDSSPPSYSQFDDVEVLGSKGEKLAEVKRSVQNKPWVAKRGGWRRLALFALLIIACIIALGVGLGVGLGRKSSSKKYVIPSFAVFCLMHFCVSDASSNSSNNNNNNTNSGSSNSNNNGSGSSSGGASGTVGTPENPAPNSTFPAGSYRFDTYLNTVSTDCTNDPATWTCYPYSTYAQNPSSSAATFEWIISPIKNSQNYTISSTDNYFSIVFSNLSLSLMHEGTNDEYYFFQTSMQKLTKPAGQLGTQNVASTCYYNETTFQGYLYTKMTKSYGSSSTNGTESSGAFESWPYAVKVEQVAAAGANVPSCVGPSGQSLGDFSVVDGTKLCDCLYLNYGT